MKIKPFIYIVLILLQPAIHIVHGADKFVPRLETKDSKFFDRWLTQGKLIIQSIQFDSGEFHVCLYKQPATDPILLHCDLGNINKLFDAEFKTKDTVLTFLNDEYFGMAEFLLVTIGVGGEHIVNEQFLDYFKKNTNQSLVKLEPYKSDPKPVFTGNQWTMKFNVATEDARIEQWFFTGQVTPFRIDSFCRENAEENPVFTRVIETK